MLFHGPRFWPQWIKRLSKLATKELGSMGTPEELMANIGALFPNTAWSKSEVSVLKSMPGMRDAKMDPDAPVWFGGPGPEFQLSPDVDGKVKSMQVSRIEPRELRLLCRRLGFVYLDLQADSLLGMLFR